MHPNLQRQRGAIAIMVALALLVLLSLVGLIVDGGLAYMTKARLNAAVDSAALAAARAVTIGNNQGEQRASAQAAAARFFAANIPQGYLLSKPRLLGTDVVFNAGTVTIDVRAEAPMPVSLMQMTGFTSMTPGASAQTIRRDLDMAFVVDTSGSLSSVDTEVRAAAKSFLNKFNVTQDRVALINFSTGAQVDTPINRTTRGFDRPAMLSKIDRYQFLGFTASVEGMWNARDQLNRVPSESRSSLRVIVFFSDGVPNGVGANLDFIDKGCDDAGVVVFNSNQYSGLYQLGSSISKSLADCDLYDRWGRLRVNKLPDWYNAHNPDDIAALREFRLVTDGQRAVSSSFTGQNITRAARNLPEAIAAKARNEGMFVFTLGMGPDLRTINSGEKGEDILKCMANVADGPSRCFKPQEPVGMYCYAATEANLTPCFSRLASAILRIAK